MPLTVGSRLGHYDVIALIGEGRTGLVWQPTATQLGRDVAMKILPNAFAAEAYRLAASGEVPADEVRIHPPRDRRAHAVRVRVRREWHRVIPQPSVGGEPVTRLRARV